MRNPRLGIAWLAAVTLFLTPFAAAEDKTVFAPAYQTPDRAIVDIVDAPRIPAVSLGPKRGYLLLMDRPRLPVIEELAQPELRLAGIRINPRTNGPSRSSHVTGLTLLNVDDTSSTPIAGLPENAEINYVRWAPDGEAIAFTVTQGAAITLWAADIASATARPLLDAPLNAAFGNPYEWLADGQQLVAQLIPANRPDPPSAPRAPSGPTIQQTTGEQAPARTYQDLLENVHDEALFAHYALTQLALVSLDGNVRLIGQPDLYRSVDPSPNGHFLLVNTLQRPFSYLVPHFRFPCKVDIWDLDGNLVKPLADLPLAENVPIGRGAVPTGPRNHNWRPDDPATVYWVEARDGGDPRAEADIRDQVLLLAAPFNDEPGPLIDLELRYAGITWGNAKLALVSESWWATRQTRTWWISPGTGGPPDDGPAPRLLFDRSFEDRYNDPGSPVTVPNNHGRRTLLTTEDGSAIYLTGAGASPEGDRPFLDQFSLVQREAKRLWQSEAPEYESFVAFVDPAQGHFLTQRESPTDPPNYFARTTNGGNLQQITQFVHPYPHMRDVYKEVIRYTRHDGVQLQGTLYLPPGKSPEDGPFPMLMWAYPREFKDADAASQMRGSPYQFNAISPNGPLPLLAAGFAVFDGPTMPIIGEGDEEPNDTYVEQLVASAQAAVDEAVRRGVAERQRIAVGGHSYGAFMTANLLAHSDLFAAGIARSGAYNRTLTPFGFQAEERTFWEAPDVYFQMSPFMHADRIEEPILIIHGEADNNSGTFPMQSERFYHALKGHGAIARFVMLPHESHGYAARESVLHMLWETVRWLDHYVKHVPE